MASPERASELKAVSVRWPSWALTPAQLAHVELLLGGALAPLDGSMGRDVATGVRETGRLPDGTPWPAPLTLRVSADLAGSLARGAMVALRDPEGLMLAALRVSEVWDDGGTPCLSGAVEGVHMPVHHDFLRLRRSAADTAAECAWRGWRRVVAFWPGRLLHLGQAEALTRLAGQLDAGLLIQVFVEPAELERATHFGRLRAIERAFGALPAGVAMLVATPDPTGGGHAGDEREAFEMRAIVTRNHGGTHLALDPGMPGSAEVATLADRASALGLKAVRLPTTVSEADVLRIVQAGADVPASMLPAAAVEALRQTYPPPTHQGFTVFFTGLSGSGKSTIAGALRARLMELTGRPVTLLDGDLVRRHLSSELGFSREHRDVNILRIGWVASEITRHGGIAICAPIAPYQAIRQRVRAMIEPVGGFALVHVATPLEVCEQRDRKGLYAKARAGLVPQFTGVSDPYEAPTDAALTIDTTTTSVEEACDGVIAWLTECGYLAD